MSATRTILLAEDDLALLRAVTLRLEAAGYLVSAVQDGYQALEQCRKLRPDLLLMDINLPAGSGTSVQQRLQDADPPLRIPVVYMTGDQSPAIIREVRKLGGFGIVYKPVHTSELLRMIAAAIDEHEQPDAEAA